MSRPRFDIDQLKELAGAKTFARGREYFGDGCVEILSRDAKRVVAEVAGSEDYRTVLTGRGKDIDGTCSCPAFGDWGFCKHMVATALAVNAAGDGPEIEAEDVLSRIRQYLKARSADELVNMIVERAEQDIDLFRALEMKSAAATEDPAALEKRLRKAIDGATRTRDFVDYEEAGRWHDAVDGVLDIIEDLASGPRADVALRLIGHATGRIASAFESIDDSDGHLGELLGRAREIHLAAATAVRPEPVALARALFHREMHDDFGTFTGAIDDYADVLGEEGLAEYRRLAEAEWKKVPATSGRKAAAAGHSTNAHAVMGILDFFAERDGDVEARIALRAKNLPSQWSYLQLAEFCLQHKRRDEALRYAEEGLWQFEDDRPDQRLLSFTANLLTKLKRKQDAETHLWRAFQKEPGLELYKQLRSIGGTAAAERAQALLESRLGNGKRGPWWSPSDLLVKILMHEKRFDAAWAVVRKFDASPYTRQELVEATDTDFPQEALAFYTAKVEQLATAGIYEEAVKTIRRMEKLCDAPARATFIAGIKVRHGRKRNFMKLLG